MISERRLTSEEKLNAFADDLSKGIDVSGIQDITIFVTGSYAREEASPYSDLDLFIVRDGSEKGNKLTNIEKALLDSSLIRISREHEFPDFSGGGEFLKVNYIKDMQDSLGGREDDFNNHFTARMLLLSESKALYNEKTYNKFLNEVIEAYFRDYHEHTKDFQPVFLLNDVIRFWRTLCLNYEHARNRKDKTPEEKNKAHLKNLKLKFSRMMTCYSLMVSILYIDGHVTQKDIFDLVQITPTRRMEKLASDFPALSGVIQLLLDKYAWFLRQTGREKEEVLRWIGDKGQRDKAFDMARDYSAHFYEIISNIPKEKEKLKYLVI
ncbi:nucleotidyltransferase domain-containing protein [Terasakiella brassicae]|nr:nucleotidyltransferase domain-containing protein [Terasakiella brassicae]